MSRLSNVMRQQIVKAACDKAGFMARRNDVLVEIDEIKFKMLIEYWGGTEKYAQLERKIKEVRTKTKTLNELGININVSKEWQSYHTDGMNIAGMAMCYPSENDNRIIIKKYNERMVVPQGPLVEELMDKTKEAEDLYSADKDVTVNVTALVNSVTTVKKLIEVWPESAELIPSEVESIKKQLPAINMSSLNAAIGIPSTP